MKLLILLSSLLVISLAAPSPPFDGKIHIPEKCEDVLAVKVCQKLTNTASNLKLTKDQVKAAIIDALKNGKKQSEDIYNSAKDFLVNQVLSKKCEDFTTPETCAKLTALAAKLKIQSGKVQEFVVRAIADGMIQAKDIYSKVVEYYKTEIATKTCEDFLTTDQCKRIREVAAALKIKTDALEKAVIDAITKAYMEGKDALQEVFENLKELAKFATCEDLLNPDVCATLRKYAEITKIGFPKLMVIVRDSIVKGYTLGKGLLKTIYDVADFFYDCEDVFTTSSCDRLKDWLGKLGVQATEIDRIVREYAKKGIATATELYNKIYEFLKSEFACKINPFCKSSLVVKRSINIDVLRQRLR